MRIATDLINKYNCSGPRYTSYPTAMEFDDSFSSKDYLQALSHLSEATLSLYIHIPFCRNICYYCACNKVITKDSSKAEKYIEYLIKEAELVADKVIDKNVRQIHFGGGTPTFLSDQQLQYLLKVLAQLFSFSSNIEIAIEVDPRTVTKERFAFFSSVGINRISVGVQDFNPVVQKAVNREHDFESVQRLFSDAREQPFSSINMDLIYGLPHQTVDSFEQTIEQVIDLKPDRIALYNYAHLPHRFKPQRRISNDDLPTAEQKVAIFESASTLLTQAGYIYIGMDHFALPNDQLNIAQQNKQLHRNFQGYTTHKNLQLVGLGVSSISKVGNCFSQNFSNLDAYYQQLDDNQLPTWRGFELDTDDDIRSQVIMQLICNFELDMKLIGKQYAIDFQQYFNDELQQLDCFIEDKLLSIKKHKIEVTETGRFFIRNICMVFDKYLQELNQIKAFSKVI